MTLGVLQEASYVVANTFKHGVSHPEMCQFLLEHGLDVDEVGGDDLRYALIFLRHRIGTMA